VSAPGFGLGALLGCVGGGMLHLLNVALALLIFIYVFSLFYTIQIQWQTLTSNYYKDRKQIHLL
jgi:uncharacterized membrane protein